MPEPPTPEQWEHHRHTITELYMAHRLSLKLVRIHMKKEHGFQATDRMYKGRFRTWGIKKNRPRQRHRQETGLYSPRSNPDPHLGRSVANTKTPEHLPPTPPSSNPSPSVVQDPEERADTLRTEIFERAMAMLLELFPKPLAETPTDDHVDIYEEFQEKLRPEASLRGYLLNRQLPPESSVMKEYVMKVLEPLHPAAPMGILSLVNQLKEGTTLHNLASCLVECSSLVFPDTHDFTHLARAIRQLLVTTATLDTFLLSMDRICDRLIESVEARLGSKSLVGFYLILLLSANKAKTSGELDKKIHAAGMEKLRYVLLHYHRNARLVLDFDHYLVAYGSLVAPNQKEVFEMAHAFCQRVKIYRAKNLNPDGTEREGSCANYYYGQSCDILAHCHRAQDTGEDRCEARKLLLESIWFFCNAPGGTLAKAERKMEKLKEWCEADGDAERLQELDRIHNAIQENKTWKTGEPLIAS